MFFARTQLTNAGFLLHVNVQYSMPIRLAPIKVQPSNDRSHAPAWECSQGSPCVPCYAESRARSRYVILEPNKPHFLTCTVLEWLPVFTRPDSVQILIHQNPVKRGYVDQPEHWRYSSARNYLGQPGLIGIDPWF